MRRAIVSLLAAGLPLVLIPPATGARRTGLLTGQVTRPATTIQCVRAPCLEPAAGLVLTILRHGLRVARPRTDLEGRFRLFLLPGRYTIRNPRFRADRTVRIVGGRTTRVEIRLDGARGEGAAKAQPRG